MSKMRICYFADAQSVHTQKWVKYFASKGHETHIISFSRARIKNVTVHYISAHPSIPFILMHTQMVKKMVRKINPDILHAHHLTVYGLCGALSGFKPFVATAWGSDVLPIQLENLATRILTRCIAMYVIRKADMVTADSKSSMRRVYKLGGTYRKIRFISHGVDLRVFHPQKKYKILREKLGIPRTALVIISTRHLKPIYDVGVLLSAIPFVLKHHPNTYFIIVGEGSLKQKFQTLVEKLKVTENVKFVGKVPNSKIPTYFAASDIYVSTSLSDTISVSLLEAMACKLPVVVTDLEGNKEMVKNGINGFLFPKKDYTMLGEKLVYLLENKKERTNFGSINRRIVEKEANYEKEMMKMEWVYADLKNESLTANLNSSSRGT